MTGPAGAPREPEAHRGYARWTAELGIALVLAVAGGLVVNGSLEQGVGWTANGPESGYFPLRIGWLLILIGAIQAAQAFRQAIRGRLHPSLREIYLGRAHLKPLLQVFVPMLAYVIAIPWLGLYISSAIFIAGFMWWQGGYRWRAVPTAIAICAVIYVLLEVFFKVELYKGPAGEWLLSLFGR